MPIENRATVGNRAVSALFRVFGGIDSEKEADARERAAIRSMHLLEYRCLSVWIPLSVLTAVAHPLGQWLGMVFGWMAAFPLGFLAMNLLPYMFVGRGPTMQWRIWLVMFGLWAWLFRDAGGVTGIVAWLWLALIACNSAAWGIELFLATLGGEGRSALAWRMFLFIAIHAAIVWCGFTYGWLWAFGAGAGVATVLCLSILRPAGQWLGPVACFTDDGKILITIDDGPDPHDTPVLLDLLDAYQTKAIFFMIGEKIRAHPELAIEVLRRGHEIGNHTLSHPQSSFWCAGPSRTRREIVGCDRIIHEIAGVRARWFRAPVGHRNLFTHPIARELNLGVMAWSRRGYDAVERDAQKVLARILPNLRAGDIVLLHEATPIAAEVLEGVLKHLSAQHNDGAPRLPR